MSSIKINVNNDIGKLNAVLLHRPGKEIENLSPENLQRFLFDDIPFLPTIQKEHDSLRKVLNENGVKTYLLEDLCATALDQDEAKEKFLEEFLIESEIYPEKDQLYDKVFNFLSPLTSKELVLQCIAGIKKTDIAQQERTHLHEHLHKSYPFYTDPMPNLLFTRDPSASIGQGLSINCMNKLARRREKIFIKYISHYHPDFDKSTLSVWEDSTRNFSIEGGDIQILNNETLMIGVSERTTPSGVERLTQDIFNTKNSQIKEVLVVELPKAREYMHLDTVFTMVDRNKFIIQKNIFKNGEHLNVYSLQKSNNNEISIKRCENLFKTLDQSLKLSGANFIFCGGDDQIDSSREQWSHGSNTFAISPGNVITYDRNSISNELLDKNGINIFEIPSSELSRGRGGPHCMTMPLSRQEI